MKVDLWDRLIMNMYVVCLVIFEFIRVFIIYGINDEIIFVDDVY